MYSLSKVEGVNVKFLLVLSKRSIQSRERFRTCKDYIIGRQTITVLKIAMDNVILELCDLRDCLASPLVVEKTE